MSMAERESDLLARAVACVDQPRPVKAPLLAYLWQQGPATAIEAADALGIERYVATEALRRLAERGAVTRTQSKTGWVYRVREEA